MECLDNYLGIDGTCGIAPTSNAYITDLEGISLKTMASIESGKWLNAQNMLNQIMRIVGQEAQERIREILGDAIVEDSVETIFAKSFCDEYWDQADGNPGILIEKRPTSLSNLFVSNFYFKSHVSVSGLVVTVTDGVESETHNITAEADEEVTVPINFETLQNSIRITYSSTDGVSDDGVSPYRGSISGRIIHSCSKCENTGTNYLMISGLDFSGNESSEYYGIKADVQLVCNTEKMVCLIARRYPMIFKYMAGVKVAREWAYSDRMNFLALSSKDDAKELALHFDQMQKQLWFDNGSAISRLLRSAEAKCFTCTGVQYSENLP